MFHSHTLFEYQIVISIHKVVQVSMAAPAASMTSRRPSIPSVPGRRLRRTNQLPLAFHRQPTDEFSVMILSLSDDLSSDMPRRRTAECRTLRHRLPKSSPRLAARAQWKTRFDQHDVDSSHSSEDMYIGETSYSVYLKHSSHLTVKNSVFESSGGMLSVLRIGTQHQTWRTTFLHL